MNKVNCIVLVSILFLFLLCGCTEQETQRQKDDVKSLFVGTWKHNRVTGSPGLPAATVEYITLYENGSGHFRGDITWDIANDTFVVMRGNETIAYEYDFFNSDTRLELIHDGDKMIWSKQ